MANRIGKYSSFREWMIWCLGLKQTTAKTTATYLRKLEENVLHDEMKEKWTLSDIHQWLNDIDAGKCPKSDLSEIKTKLTALLEKALWAKNGRGDKECRLPDDYDTLKGGCRAFNNYLKYLVAVSDCFSFEDAKEVNPEINDISPLDSQSNYDRRLQIFRKASVSKLIQYLETPGLVDNILDCFHSIISETSQELRRAELTSFMTSTSQEYVGNLLGWRAEILNTMPVEFIGRDDCSIKHKLEARRKSPESTTFTTLFSTAVSTLRRLEESLYPLSDEAHTTSSILSALSHRLNPQGNSLSNNASPAPGFKEIYNAYVSLLNAYKEYVSNFIFLIK